MFYTCIVERKNEVVLGWQSCKILLNSADGMVKIWDERKSLLTEITVDDGLSSACFLNNAGDLLLGYRNHIFIISHRKGTQRSTSSSSHLVPGVPASLFTLFLNAAPFVRPSFVSHAIIMTFLKASVFVFSYGIFMVQ